MSRDVALRQSALAPSAALARVLRSQARQEAVHAAVFDTAVQAVRRGAVCAPALTQALTGYAASLHADLDASRLAASMLGLQCVFENLACVALEPPPGDLERVGDHFVPMLAIVKHQEIAHRRLGELWVPRLAGIASTREQGALRRAQARYIELAEAVTQAALSTLQDYPADHAHYLAATSACLASLREEVVRLTVPWRCKESPRAPSIHA
jgi:hypothetical protein